MLSDDDYEDGEILEEGEEPEQRSAPRVDASVPADASVSPAVPKSEPPARQHEPILVDPPAAQRRRVGPAPPLPPPQPPLPPGPSAHYSHQRQPPPRSYPSSDGGHQPSYAARTPLSHRNPMRYTTGNGATSSARRDPNPPAYDQDERNYCENLVVKYPRQEPRSRVLLDFGTWMASARMRKRLTMDDVQALLLKALQARDGATDQDRSRISPYLFPSLFPGAEPPAKVCVVLLGQMHPSVLQKYRAKLGFFDACSSVPVMLAKPDAQMRRSEAPVPELLYKFARPPVDTRELAEDELFYGHEVTFLMKHSIGYTDELVFQPAGTFSRKSQPLGGTWELDGDLLHLKWRQQRVKSGSHETAAPGLEDVEEQDDAYTLDVLVSQNVNMHSFSTDPVTDETYAHKTPEHLAGKKRRREDKPRTITLSLVKATAVEVPRRVDGSLVWRGKRHRQAKKQTDTSAAKATEAIETTESGVEPLKPLKAKDFEYYTLSLAEMRQHEYPTDVEEEQRRLDEATDGNTRDRYVATKPRPTKTDGDDVIMEEKEKKKEEGGEFVYALDCEMCETDLGMELTRVTVVDMQGSVVYDQLVKPQSTIINYHTEFSGISEETLRDTKYVLADVQQDLLSRFLFTDTLLVGHSLTSDLRALRLVHLKLADTAILYPHERGFPFKASLKYLSKTFLRQDIQMKAQEGHDSAEDAIAAMELLLLKVREGPWFGIPEENAASGAFDSLVDKALALDKTLAMFRLRCNDDKSRSDGTEDGEEEAEAGEQYEAKRKPWALFASGDLKTRSQSPFRHVQTVLKKAQSSPKATAATAAHAVTTVESCRSWDALKSSLQDALQSSPSGEDAISTSRKQPDLCWVEIEPPSASAAQCNDFVSHHDRWMAQQLAHCEAVDSFLQQVRDEVLPAGTLLLALPQGDLSLLRYLKGLRTRSRWKDTPSSTDDLGSPEELHAAVGDAFRGVMDSCLFLMQR